MNCWKALKAAKSGRRVREQALGCSMVPEAVTYCDMSQEGKGDRERERGRWGLWGGGELLL